MSGQLDYVIKIWKFQLNFGIGNTADFMFLSLFLYSRLPEVQKSKVQTQTPDSTPKNKFSEIKFDQILISNATI